MIATKFTPRTQEEIDSGVSGQQHIENYLNKSLENLGMDYIDLYICHMWDYHTLMEEIMEEIMEELYVPHALAGVMAQNGKQKAGNVV